MPLKNLTKEIHYVKGHKDELLKEHLNKFLIIHGEKVVGSFDNYEHAAGEAIRLFGIDGEFLIHQMLLKNPVNFIMEASL